MFKRRSVDSSSYSCSSSTDSAFGENEVGSVSSPTPESVRATLDLYVSAAKVGREAFARGDLRAAVQQFDQALALELQTELECIYDPSIGMVSGLVRKEVSERARSSPRHSPANANCSKILGSLQKTYTQSESALRLNPADPKPYLRMGAALCCANEWEKAKRIYTEGINTCKDRKELKLALRRLCKMEQITTGKEIPTEPYKPSTTDMKSRTLPSIASALRMRRKSASLEDMDLLPSIHTLNNRQRLSASPSPGLVGEKRTKPKARRVSSFGRIRQKKVSEISPHERESWSKVFQASDFCNEQVRMIPSAITQMRRLSVDFLDSDDDEQTAGQPSKTNPSFTVVNFQSMRIDSDDSELEDD